MTTVSVALGYYTLPMPDRPVVGMVLRCRNGAIYVITSVDGDMLQIRFIVLYNEDATRSWGAGSVEHDEYLGQAPPEMFGGQTP